MEKAMTSQALSPAVKNTRRSVQYANISYLVFGVLLFILAALMIYQTQAVQSRISDMTTELVHIEDKRVDFDIAKYLVSMGASLAKIATYFIVLSLVGFCGVHKMHSGCLIIYMVMIIVLITVQMVVAFCLIFYPEKLGDYLKEPMNEMLRNDFRGFNSTESISMAFNFMMITYQCCGITDYHDFDKAVLWERVLVVKVPLPAAADPVKDLIPLIAINLTTPIACCKARGDIADIVEKLSKNISCAIKPTLATNNMNQGCLGILMKSVRLLFLMSAIGLGFVVTFQVGSTISAYKLIKSINKKRNAYQKMQETEPEKEKEEKEEKVVKEEKDLGTPSNTAV